MSDEKIDVLAVMDGAARMLAIHVPGADDAAFEEMRAARAAVAEMIRAAAAAYGEELRDAVARVIDIVDNMGNHRQLLCEESIKELDRGLVEMRSKVSAARNLEEKLALMKDQREMEHIRAERRKRLFELMDDGAIYAHDPLPRDELLALIAPLREIMAANA